MGVQHSKASFRAPQPACPHRDPTPPHTYILSRGIILFHGIAIMWSTGPVITYVICRVLGMPGQSRRTICQRKLRNNLLVPRPRARCPTNTRLRPKLMSVLLFLREQRVLTQCTQHCTPAEPPSLTLVCCGICWGSGPEAELLEALATAHANASNVVIVPAFIWGGLA